MAADFFAYPTVHPSAASDPTFLGEDDSKYMRLENHEYQTSKFRRLHLELGKRNDGLEVVRMVMFPRCRYALPILALDVVCVPGGKVAFAIADASPVKPSGDLPPFYLQAMSELRKKHFPETWSDLAEAAENLPPWAKKIFSEGCLCLRPRTEEDVAAFIGYCAELVNFHIEASSCFDLIQEEGEINEVYKCHQRYAGEQQGNQKTRAVLQASFGADFADAYMRQTLFDFEPGLRGDPSAADAQAEGQVARVGERLHKVQV